MKIFHSLFSTIAIVILFFSSNISICFGQHYQCNTDILTPQQFANAVNQVDEINNFANNHNSVNADIPVRFTVIRNDNGEGVNITQADIDIGIANLNDKFQPLTGFNFFQCGETIYLNNTSLQSPFIAGHSFTSSAINVYIGNNAPLVNSAQFPCSLGSPDDCDYDNIINLSGPATLTNMVFPHEVGHHFGLFHTFHQVADYNYPVNSTPPVQEDHPHEGGGIKRELVIREDLPFSSGKNFPNRNCLAAADLLCDTPADCAAIGVGNDRIFPSSSDEDYPNCINSNNVSVCPNGCTFDPNTCTYTGDYLDYNQDPIDPFDSSIGANIMSYYWGCSTHFTEGQMLTRTLFYYDTYRKHQYEASFCNNWNDRVEFWGTNSGMDNITVRMEHPNETKFCNVISNDEGDFNGVIHDNLVTSNVIDVNFSNTYEEWVDEVTVLDLTLISWHILNIVPFNKGYAIIAADANNDGEVSTLDLVKLRRLILGQDTELSEFNQPWRFVPEYLLMTSTIAAHFHNDPFNMTIDGTSYSNEAPYLNPDWIYEMPIAATNRQGFDAIKIGDVNGSAEPESPPFNPDDHGEPIYITIEPTIEGLEAKYDFKVENFEDIIGYQMEISFDDVSLNYLHSLERNLPGVIEDYFYNVEEGTIKTLWYDANGSQGQTLSNLEKIFGLVFNGNGNFSSANVELTTESLGGARLRAAPKLKNFAIDSDGKIHPIIQKFKSENSLNSIKANPNPFNEKLDLEIKMLKADFVELKLFNVLGQPIFQSKIFLKEGTNVIKMEELITLPKGILFITANNNGKTVATKIIGH